MFGGGGHDRLIGGGGLDTITGGGDGNIYVYASANESPRGASRDRIKGFNAGNAGTSVDRIDLKAIDADTARTGNQAFSFIGAAPFSLNLKGELRVFPAGSGAIVEGDINGDAVADFQIQLLGFANLTNLTAIDFIR